MVLVDSLSGCLNTLQSTELSRDNRTKLVATVNALLSVLAIDYEPQDAQMILDSGLIPLLHRQFSIRGNRATSIHNHQDGIVTSMWTLYRFIMVLCMGGIRSDSHSDTLHESYNNNGSDFVVRFKPGSIIRWC